MSSRRNKPVPPPIFPVAAADSNDRGSGLGHLASNSSGSQWGTRTPSHAKDVAAASGNGAVPGSAPRARKADAVDSGPWLYSAPPSQPVREGSVPTAAPVYFSPTSMGAAAAAAAGVAAFPTHVCVLDGKGLGPTETVLLSKQLTNTHAVIDLVRLDFSDAMRGYRVYKQDLSTRPWLRLFGTNDMMLLAVAVSFLLSCVVSLNGAAVASTDPLLAKAARGWWWGSASAPENPETARRRALLEESFFFKVRLSLSVLCFLLVAIRFLFALQRVYIEEVIAIRGVGIQLTDYGVFNQIRRRQLIDMKLIRSLVIHDAFFRYQPIFFLSSSVENQSKRIVFFAETLPRLAALQMVLRGLRHILYGEEEEGPSLSEMEQMQSSQQAPHVPSDDDTYTRSDDSVVDASQELVSSHHNTFDEEDEVIY